MRRSRNGELVGVDLNRNWGPYELWNYPNDGSNDDENADDYRGSYTFFHWTRCAEPETKAIRDFVLQHNVKGAIDFRSFSDLFLYPWGHNNTVSDSRYPKISKKMFLFIVMELLEKYCTLFVVHFQIGCNGMAYLPFASK